MLARAAHRATRAVTVALLLLLVAIAALTALTLASPQTARAIDLNPIDDLCKPSQKMYLPGGGDNGGLSEGSMRELYKASATEAEGDGFVTFGATGAGLWREAGDGMTFETFGLSMCDDMSATVLGTIGAVTWNFLAVWPAKNRRNGVGLGAVRDALDDSARDHSNPP